LVGILVGTYSSVFVAAALLLDVQNLFGKKTEEVRAV
jgi:preprotein translocase subunit SecF